MRIAIVGSGGVGGYFGALLARGGNDVWFIARGQHLQAIRANGLHVKSYDEEFTLNVNATDNAERIGAVVGMDRVLGGLAYIESGIAAPGVIEQRSKVRKIVFGELDGSVTFRVKTILETFRSAGIDCEISTNIRKELWEKFIFICAFAGVSGVTRCTMGEVMKFPETREMFIAAMKEIEAVARALGVPLDRDIVDHKVHFADGLAPSQTPSMLKDLEQGKRLELESLSGTVVRLGGSLRIPTPVNHFIYACLRPQNEKALEKSSGR